MKKSLMAFAAVAVLAACTNMHPEPSPQLTFANYAPQTLNVQSSDVVEAYQNPNDPQDVSGQFVLAPSEAIKRYAANRFRAGGSPGGSFTISIQDARVHVRQIDQNSKVLKWADVGTEDEYHLFMTLLVTAAPDGFNGRQNTTIKMDRTLVMPSSVTLAEREMRQTKFLEKLIADVDARVTEAMDQTPAIRR
jgi:hypothetical protein